MKRIVNKDIPGKQKGISRREFVKTTGATGLALATGAGVGYFAGRAPALAQAREVHVLAWSHFIPDADELKRN